jgi:hypothetical protein
MDFMTFYVRIKSNSHQNVSGNGVPYAHLSRIVNMREGERCHGRMARGGHGVPKVSPGTAMPYPFTLCGRATPVMALWPFQEWPARRARGLLFFPTPLDAPRCMPIRDALSSHYI